MGATMTLIIICYVNVTHSICFKNMIACVVLVRFPYLLWWMWPYIRWQYNEGDIALRAFVGAPL